MIQQLKAALVALPVNFVQFVAGLFIAVTQDTVLMALALGSVAVGFQTNVLVALAVFLLGYTLVRSINIVANAIGFLGRAVNPPSVPDRESN